MTLPNFLIIGAARCGTTSLWAWLRQHPDVFMSAMKEAGYFCHEELPAHSVKTIEEYERLFDGVTSEKAVGEATPRYLPTPETPKRIARDLPDVRLIASLRNPADRAWSYYHLTLNDGTESRSPDEAIKPGEISFDHSLYAESLERYLHHFPRENIKVILLDDLIAQPGNILRDLFTFLNVDPDVSVETKRRGRGRGRAGLLWRTIRGAASASLPVIPRRFRGQRLPFLRSAPESLSAEIQPMPPGLRRNLLEAYREDIVATGALIGRDLSHWHS